MKKLLFATMALNLLLTGCSSSSAATSQTVSTPAIAVKTSESLLEDAVSPEWKKTMDAYEDFFDEYVEFMKTYDASTLDSELITKYTELMQKFNEYSAELNDVEEGSLSKADYAYYIDVNSRIQKKLLEVIGQ